MRPSLLVLPIAICLSVGLAWAGDGLQLTSAAFEHKGEIPAKHTCEGKNLSPPLSWKNVPKGTKSLVLIIDDPDAPDPKKPKLTWDHWLIYNLGPATRNLPEGIAPGNLPKPSLQGKNSWKKTPYGGPCPPIGRHRYFHKLYALDAYLGDLKTPDKKTLLAAMEGHVLEKTELIGTYLKTKKNTKPKKGKK